MTLYEIDKSIQELIDPETGELLDYDAFSHFQMEREKKIENMALWVKNLTAEAKAIKEEEANLKERRQSLERKVERLKTYLGIALGGEKFSTPKCTVTFRSSSALKINDTEGLTGWLIDNGHGNCLRFPSPEINKTGVTKLIQSGEAVPYAEIETRKSVGVK